MAPPPFSLKTLLIEWGAGFALLVLARGRAGRQLRRRLEPRRLVIRLGLSTLVGFAMRHWIGPMAATVEAERTALEERLGRKPTRDELEARLRVAFGGTTGAGAA